MKIFLVIEDYGFYGDDPRDAYISSEEINRSCHSKVRFAGSTREAAEQELAQAQYDLAFLYYNAQGVTQNYGQAKKWFKKAAKQ